MSALRLYAAPAVLALWAILLALGVQCAAGPLVIYLVAQIVGCRERWHQITLRRRGRHVAA